MTTPSLFPRTCIPTGPGPGEERMLRSDPPTSGLSAKEKNWTLLLSIVPGLVLFSLCETPPAPPKPNNNEDDVSEKGELEFSLLALNLWASHGASNCFAKKDAEVCP